MLTRPFHGNAIVAIIGFFVFITFWLNLDHLQSTSLGSKLASGIPSLSSSSGQSHLPPSSVTYIDQVFGATPSPYAFPHLSAHCARTEWKEDRKDVYLQCGGMFAGMTSIMSEVKVCLKMAVDAGVNIILPTMPLRSSDNLLVFNNNEDESGSAYMPYDQWFDAVHLIEGFKRACPQMKILYPEQLEKGAKEYVEVKREWEINVFDAPGYRAYVSHFWTGRPFKPFFDTEFARLLFFKGKDGTGTGITAIKMKAIFLIFRITDDPTGGDLKLWNDLGMLVRFLEKPRSIVQSLMAQLNGRPYYGVHFRAENDTIWSSPEHQMGLDLDALDKAWALYKNDKGINPTQKPLVYLACGDEDQIRKFQQAGKERGWEVTHKWQIARESSNNQIVKEIDALPFDFQGAVDMGMMLQGHFFIGISGSAFSNTVAHARDETGRYRGSSLGELWDGGDGGARSHLFLDGPASSYPCCL
jgi:hypothetical protein